MSVQVIRLLIVRLIKNIVGMMLTERMVFWALEFAAKQTSTHVDDSLVRVVRAAYKSDAEVFKESVEALVVEVRKNG